MPQLRIAAVLALAIVLQLSLRKVWPPLVFIDLPLVIVVYVALQREAWQALITGTLAGLAVDAASGGVLGTGGFSKTLTAYLIFFAATRVNLENPLLRIPILAAAAAIDGCVYVGLHKLLGQTLEAPFVQTIAYRVIGTTIVGTLALLMLDNLLSDKARQRRQFADRRKVAKRASGFGKRRT
jgi:rod shape-determining protein MreD